MLTLTDYRCNGLSPQRGTSMSAQTIGLGNLSEKSSSPEGAAQIQRYCDTRSMNSAAGPIRRCHRRGGGKTTPFVTSLVKEFEITSHTSFVGHAENSHAPATNGEFQLAANSGFSQSNSLKVFAPSDAFLLAIGLTTGLPLAHSLDRWSASNAARIIRLTTANNIGHALTSRAKSGSVSAANINRSQPFSAVSVATICATTFAKPLFSRCFRRSKEPWLGQETGHNQRASRCHLWPIDRHCCETATGNDTLTSSRCGENAAWACGKCFRKAARR